MTTYLNADLHCHSVVSDGTLTPEDLIISDIFKDLQTPMLNNYVMLLHLMNNTEVVIIRIYMKECSIQLLYNLNLEAMIRIMPQKQM